MSTVTNENPSSSLSPEALYFSRDPFGTISDFVMPAVTFITNKVQDVWNAVQPYFASTGRFLKSDLGISLALLTLSIVSCALSTRMQGTALSVAFLATGILSFAATIMTYIHMIDMLINEDHVQILSR